MTYSGTSDPRGNVALAGDWAERIARTNPVDAVGIAAAYAAFAPTVHYDPNLAIAQAAHETGWFTSPAWRSRYNPAGLGITGDNVAGPDFHAIARGVQAHLALLNCYYGDGADPWGVLASVGFGGFALGKTTLNGMNGVWAVPGTGYGDAIAAIANEVTGGVTAPPPPPTAITLSAINQVARDHLGKTLTDEGNAEFGMCEQEFEEWCQEAGLPRVRYASAAADGDVLVANGVLRQTMPPPPGAGLVWGRAFDPEGHICEADDYPFVITTYPGTVSRIDAVANGWYSSRGFLGWFVPDGAVQDAAAPPQYTVDGYDVGQGIAQLVGCVSDDTAGRLRLLGKCTGPQHDEWLIVDNPDPKTSATLKKIAVSVVAVRFERSPLPIIWDRGRTADPWSVRVPLATEYVGLADDPYVAAVLHAMALAR